MPALPDDPATPAAARLRILLVEDNDYLREVICALLERDDREIVDAASAEQAMAQLASKAFDVLITDVNLGAMSGIDLAHHLRGLLPEAWVIVSSGYAIDPQALGGLGSHVRVLPKPYEPEDMERLLAEVHAATFEGR